VCGAELTSRGEDGGIPVTLVLSEFRLERTCVGLIEECPEILALDVGLGREAKRPGRGFVRCNDGETSHDDGGRC